MATRINSTQTYTATSPKPAIQSQPLRKPKVAAADTVNIGGIKFAGGDQKNVDQKSFLERAGTTARKAGGGLLGGGAALLFSNLITIPAGIMMMCTGVGIVPGLATIFLGPLVAGALGAYFGSR